MLPTHSARAIGGMHAPPLRVSRNPQRSLARAEQRGELAREPRRVLTAGPDLERVQRLLLDRYTLSYRFVMLVYRLGRRVGARRSVADGAALVITVDSGSRPIPGPLPDDGSHTPPHGDALAEHGLQ